jgi:hypothetical protein
MALDLIHFIAIYGVFCAIFSLGMRRAGWGMQSFKLAMLVGGFVPLALFIAWSLLLVFIAVFGSDPVDFSGLLIMAVGSGFFCSAFAAFGISVSWLSVKFIGRK